MRRFELAGNPARFWQFELDGPWVRLHWGEVDTDGRKHDRKFPSHEDARSYVKEQIAAQRAKGYVEVDVAQAAHDAPVSRTVRMEWIESKTRERQFAEIVQDNTRVTITTGTRVRGVDRRDVGDPVEHETIDDASLYFEGRVESYRYDHGADEVTRDTSVVTHQLRDNPALEAECRAAPDDPAPWAVYADWLLSHGNVVGEIASRAAAGATADALRLVTEHELDLAGEHVPDLVFRHGFVVGATIKLDHDEAAKLPDVTRDFLASPLGRFVESLRFGLAGFESNNDWGPTLRAITESPCAPHIRELRFDDYTYEDQEISWTGFGDFAFAWPHLPALELLHIRAGVSGNLGELHLPALKTFIRESGGLSGDELAAIARARWPQLAHLEIWFGSPNYGAEGTLESLHEILANDLPRLAHLGVVNCQFIDDVIPALASWPGLARLSSLDLSKSVMHTRATELLVQHAASFRHLASLDLSENLLQESHANAIRRVLDNVIIGEQREYDFEDGDDEEDSPRYVAVGE